MEEGRGSEIEMRAQLGAQQIDQGGVHELVVVGDAQGEEGLVAELGGEALVHPGRVGLFHAKDQVSPADVAGGDLDARAIFGAGGAGLVKRVVAEQRLSGRAAPFIESTDEEDAKTGIL